MKIHAQTYNRFVNQHQLIKGYIDKLPPSAINHRLTPEKRSIHETVAFICRYQYIFLDRLNRMLNETAPSFKKYNAAADEEFHACVCRSTGALLHELYRVRDEIKILINQLETHQYSRTGIHEKKGEMNVCEWLDFFLLQESKHLYKIFKMAGSYLKTIENNKSKKPLLKV
jgi:hypothetical protein